MGRLPGSGRVRPGWGKPDGGEGKGPAAAAAGPDSKGREMNWRGRTGGMERPVFLAKSRPSDPKKVSSAKFYLLHDNTNVSLCKMQKKVIKNKIFLFFFLREEGSGFKIFL